MEKYFKLQTRVSGSRKLIDVIIETGIIEWGGYSTSFESEPIKIPWVIFRPYQDYEKIADIIKKIIVDYIGYTKWGVNKRKRTLWGFNYFIYPLFSKELAKKHKLPVNKDSIPLRDSFYLLTELEKDFCILADEALLNCSTFLKEKLILEGFIKQKNNIQ